MKNFHVIEKKKIPFSIQKGKSIIKKCLSHFQKINKSGVLYKAKEDVSIHEMTFFIISNVFQRKKGSFFSSTGKKNFFVIYFYVKHRFN